MKEPDQPSVIQPVEAIGSPVVKPVVRRAEAPAWVGAESVLQAFDAHAGRLRAFALAAVREPETADDLVQETFVRLIGEVRAGRPPEALPAWLFRVCGNLITSRGRRMVVAQRFVALLVDRRTSPSPEELTGHAESHRELRDALARLPADARVALLMAANGNSAAEIGEAIGRTAVATATYISRSRVRLRKLLAEAEADR
jgi:RNA polymerase sigma-70 factor (ECF subfamily)